MHSLLIFFLAGILMCPQVWAQTSPAAPNPAASAAPTIPPAASPTTTSESTITENQLTDSIQYSYDPTGKKDPFKPYRAPRTRGDNRPSAPIDPLSQVEVTTLQLIAIMWNTARPRAVIKDSQGRIFTIFKNNRIGRNEGIVVDIREGEVVIVEKFDDGLGNIVREPRVLEMKVRSDGEPNMAGG